MSQPPAQKRPRHEVQELPSHSKEFPEGYGDFVFKSSDGVVFHFPRFLLSHVSPVFKDMYAVSDGAQAQEMMIFTEDYATLEYLLRHIDPAKGTPELDWNLLGGTLKAAFDTIFKWFERGVLIARSADYYPTVPNPMLAYALSRRYGLRAAAGLALRQLLQFRVSEITGGQHVDSSLMSLVIRWRGLRTQHMVSVINECPKYPYAGNGCNEHCKDNKRFRDWKIWAIQAIIDEPSWSAILSSIERHYGKPSCECVILGDAKRAKEMEKAYTENLPQ
ncbi:hypothetical protein CPB86DRAFT_818538 [Serendipita vermifera]|nr:hypothetical protein CPB86DRAFT_818538 [Serendipita vermifera]